jgi:hypothetical protein
MARRRVEAAHSLGDALFLGASLLSAGFTVPMSRAKLDPLHAAALVSTGSLAFYGPLYQKQSAIRFEIASSHDSLLAQAGFELSVPPSFSQLPEQAETRSRSAEQIPRHAVTYRV